MPFFHVFAIAVVPCGQKTNISLFHASQKDRCMAEAATVFQIDPIFVFQNDPPPTLSHVRGGPLQGARPAWEFGDSPGGLGRKPPFWGVTSFLNKEPLLAFGSPAWAEQHRWKPPCGEALSHWSPWPGVCLQPGMIMRCEECVCLGSSCHSARPQAEQLCGLAHLQFACP